MECEQRLDEDVDEDVVAAVMRQLMRDREVADQALAAGHETIGQRDDLVEDAKCHRPRNRRGFDQADGAHLAHRTRLFEQFAAQLAIEPETPGHEDRGPGKPQDQQRG